MTSRTSSLAGVVLIEVLSSGNCGTERENKPAVVLIPRFPPVTQEIIAYRAHLSGLKRISRFPSRLDSPAAVFFWEKPATRRFFSVSTGCDTALGVLLSSGRSVSEFAPTRSITCEENTVTKDIVSDLMPITGWLILTFWYFPYAPDSVMVTVLATGELSILFG
jgi:hypothetical protein